MKYWFYSEGNIMGPYAPCELLTLPAFAQDSLVCLETSSGDHPGDWKPAFQVAEISEALSVGTGKMISSGYGGMNDLYALETGFSQAPAPDYGNVPSQGYSYENLLNTIDGILKAGTAGPESAPEREKTLDYDLMDKFDIRLSKIQEELEAARWEKNLLLEKMRMKELEDRKQRERITELESRLKAALGDKSEQEKEFEQLRHMVDLRKKTDTLRKIEEIKEENIYKAPEAPRPEPEKPIEKKESVIFKSLRPSGEIKLEQSGISGGAPGEDRGIISGKLKSLGGGGKPVPAPEEPVKRFQPAPEPSARESSLLPSGSGAFPVISGAADKTARPPAPEPPPVLPPARQQAEVVYDLTAAAPGTAEPAENIPSHPEPGGRYPGKEESPAVPAGQRPAHEQTFYPEGALPQPDYQAFSASGQQPKAAPKTGARPGAQPSAKGAGGKPGAHPPAKNVGGKPGAQPRKAPDADDRGAQPKAAPKAGGKPAVQAQFQNSWQGPDATGPATEERVPTEGKTERMPAFAPAGGALPEPKEQASLQASSPVSAETLSARTIRVLPDADKTERIAAFPVKEQQETRTAANPARKGGKTAFLVILVAFAAIAAGGLGFFFLGDGLSLSEFSMLDFNSSKSARKGSMPSQLEPQDKVKPVQPQPGEEEAAAPVAPEPGKTSVPSVANENVKNAMAIVKNYRLSGGRGAIGGWFANSFLSGSAGGASEEWSATPLHGSILVVQYRLIRQKQDPLLYQFEVDVSKNDIIRGLNNSAIELLDFSSDKAAIAEALAPRRKPVAKKLSAKAVPSRRAARPREFPILPLPDAPDALSKEADPTGFEDAEPEAGEKVKYIRAQESDEELF